MPRRSSSARPRLRRSGHGDAEIAAGEPRATPVPIAAGPRSDQPVWDSTVSAWMSLGAAGTVAPIRKRVPPPARGQYRSEQGQRRSCARLRRRPHAVAALADYVAVNVSSPNTPGLRAWQTGDALDRLLAALDGCPCPSRRPAAHPAQARAGDRRRGLAKLLDAIDGAPIAGLILTNTTTARPPSLVSREREEEGGLSGPPHGAARA